MSRADDPPLAVERDLAEHTNLLGVVLNTCPYTGEDYGYY